MPSSQRRPITQPPIETLRRNRLLAALPAEELEYLRPQLTLQQVTHHDLQYQMGDRIQQVWFPIDALISLLTQLQDGLSIEMAAVGNEGMTGMPVFLGLTADTHQAQGQVSGAVLEMNAAAFRTTITQLPGLHAMLLRYTQVLMLQMGQGAACNARHALSERCARWLLEAHDRVQRDHFALTQDFLASMLGVTRPSVTIAAGILQQAGMIQYHRGRITIVDRTGLEASACECYRFITGHIDALLGPAPAPLPAPWV